jgi:hypothetical protein
MMRSMAEILGAARMRAGLSERELWVGYLSLGGTAGPAALDAYLDGSATPSGAQYDVIAQALNDTFVARGENHPVPYAEDLSD